MARQRAWRCVVLALAALAANADDGAGALAEATARYQQDRRQLIANELLLSPEQATKFWPLYEEMQRELSVLTAKRRAMISEFGENYDDMSDAAAKKMIVERLDYEEARARLGRKYVGRFEKVLPAKQLARYYQIETKIRAFVDAGITETLPLVK